MRAILHLAVTLDKTDTTLNQGFHQDSCPRCGGELGIYTVFSPAHTTNTYFSRLFFATFSLSLQYLDNCHLVKARL